MGAELLAPVVARQYAVREMLPVCKILRLRAEGSDAGEPARALSQCLGHERAQVTQARTRQRPKACVHPPAQQLRILARDEAQPVAALLQHLRDEPLEVHPVVVETLKEQLRVGYERGIGFRAHERAPRCALVEPVRGLGDVQHSAGMRGDRQLTCQPVVEGVDGLDPQTLWLRVDPPAACRRVRERRRGERAQLRRFRVGRRNFCAQRADDARAHLGGRLAREGDGENLARVFDRAQEP